MDSSSTRTARRTLRFPLLVWAVWRAGHAIILLGVGGNVVDDTFAFDGGWFRTILAGGYVVTDRGYAAQQNPAFFPGVTWVTEPLTWIVGDRTGAFVAANILGLAAFVSVFVSVRSWANEASAKVALLALALWPASMFLWAFYSEGLFISATALALWAQRRGRPVIASVAIFAAATTRVIGLGLGPILALARLVDRRRLDRVTVLFGASSIAGLLAVMAMQEAQVEDALAFVHAQSAWRETSLPWTPITTAISDIVGKLPSPAMELSLNLVAVILTGLGVVLFFAYRRRFSRPLSAALWSAAAWFAPLWTTAVSSQVRFSLAAWPVAVVVAVPDRNRAWVRRGAVVAAVFAIALTAVLLRRWANAEFVA